MEAPHIHLAKWIKAYVRWGIVCNSYNLMLISHQNTLWYWFWHNTHHAFKHSCTAKNDYTWNKNGKFIWISLIEIKHLHVLTSKMNTWYEQIPHFRGTLYIHWLSIILRLFSKCVHDNVSGEITYPFLIFNSATVETREWICDYFSIQGKKTLAQLGHANLQLMLICLSGQWVAKGRILWSYSLKCSKVLQKLWRMLFSS